MINGNLFENCTPKLTKHFPGSQKSDNLSSALGQTVVKWTLTRNCCGPATYTDNASNVVKLQMQDTIFMWVALRTHLISRPKMRFNYRQLTYF